MYRTEIIWMGEKITTLADIIPETPKILFVGLNPSPISVNVGHYHQGKLGKQFWSFLEKWSLLPPLKNKQFHDELLTELSFGITDLVKRPTPSAIELTYDERIYGGRILKDLIYKVKPQVVCSIYKKALSELVKPRSLSHRWGYLEDIQIGDAKVFILPFPYRCPGEVQGHMPILKKIIRT